MTDLDRDKLRAGTNAITESHDFESFEEIREQLRSEQEGPGPHPPITDEDVWASGLPRFLSDEALAPYLDDEGQPKAG